jgi:hypothetical protein
MIFRPLEVEGDDFSKCLSNASLILFRSKLPPTISDLDDPPPRSLYISAGSMDVEVQIGEKKEVKWMDFGGFYR